MQRKENKWLLRKVSGSRGRHTYKPDYKETRLKKYNNFEDLPKREGMGKGHSFLDTSLVKRWLYKQVGKDFDDIYSDFLLRIQPKFKEEYKNCIYDREDSDIEFEDDFGNKKKIKCNQRFYIPSEISWLLKSLGYRKIEIFGAKLGKFSREDKLTTKDFEMLVIAHK